MFAEDDNIIPPPNGIQEMTTCTSHLPPLVLRLTTPHIYTWRIYKYAALLGPNVCFAEAQEVGTSTAIRGNWQYLQSAQEC